MEQLPNSPLRCNHPEHWYFCNDDGNKYNTVSAKYSNQTQQKVNLVCIPPQQLCNNIG